MNNTGKKNGALCLTKEYVEKSSYNNIFKKIYVTLLSRYNRNCFIERFGQSYGQVHVRDVVPGPLA